MDFVEVGTAANATAKRSQKMTITPHRVARTLQRSTQANVNPKRVRQLSELMMANRWPTCRSLKLNADSYELRGGFNRLSRVVERGVMLEFGLDFCC
jgi:hypothetical protein